MRLLAMAEDQRKDDDDPFADADIHELDLKKLNGEI